MDDLGLDYDYIKDNLVKDIEEIEKYLNREINLNDLLDGPGR